MTTVPTQTTTVRLPEELWHDAKLIAQIDGISFSELTCRAISEHLKNRGIDPVFRARLHALIEKDKRILARLTNTSEDISKAISASKD